MSNGIAGFGGLNFFLEKIIMSEPIGKCVIGFCRFVRALKNPMKIVERDHYFQCSA
jgi:hypothetical protein